MSKLHDPTLLDNEKPLYIFKHEVINDRLINALETFHEVTKQASEPYYAIYLVPTEDYFISYRKSSWVYSEKVYVTQEQVDKYLLLFDSFEMPFLEYMEILHEG